MTDRRVMTLAQLGTVITGGTPSSRNPEEFGTFAPFITPTDVDAGRKFVDVDRRLSVLGAKVHHRRLLPPGAVCFVSIGSTIGKMCMTLEPSMTNQQINSVIVDPKVADNDYVFYALWQMAPAVRATASGSATPILNKTTFSAIQMVVPPLDEQRAVGGLLAALDDKIASNWRGAQCSLDLLDECLKGFGRSLPTAHLRELVTSSRETFDPSSVGESLVDHFSIPAFDVDRLPERVAGESIMSNKFRVTAPSVLVSRLNPRTNRTWLAVPDADVPACCSTEFLVLRPMSGVTVGALWLALRDSEFTGTLARRVTGTSGSHQRARPEDALDIAVPDVRALTASEAGRADVLIGLVHQRQTESRRLATLRDALMPELLSGRLRFQEARQAAGI